MYPGVTLTEQEHGNMSDTSTDTLTPHKITRDEFIKGYLLSYFGQWAANVANAGNPGWQKQILRPPVEDIVF